MNTGSETKEKRGCCLCGSSFSSVQEDKNMERQPLIVLTGPTAVGKTALSLQLAAAVGGEIVSADSMQVYRHMNIGSAKIRPDEMRGVRHHLLDELEPWESFHVVRFQEMARAACEGIWQRGHIPIVTGGTGFYIQALLYDIDFTENDEDTAFRHDLEQVAETQGGEVLHERLRQVDPESAKSIHAHNTRRVIRALEFYEKTGTPISQHNEEQRRRLSPYRFVYLVLTRERGALYERIDRRVEQMIADGLVSEVKALKAMGLNRQMPAVKGLGYKEIWDYLEGGLSLEEAVYQIKRDTRHFAKRQMTWFRREKDAVFVPLDHREEREVLSEILEYLRERKIIGNGAFPE